MRVYLWGAPDATATASETASDATVELELESPEGVAYSAFLHTRLSRRAGRWIVPDIARATETITAYLADHAWESDSNLADARWLLQPPPLDTAAQRWAGAAKEIIKRELGVVYEEWMQDWPLEAAEGSQLEAVMALFDRTTDRAARFDAMALALFCFDERVRAQTAGDAPAWFASRLHAGIAEFGHLAAYWALLHARPLVADESFAISKQLRQIFWDALVEVPASEVDA